VRLVPRGILASVCALSLIGVAGFLIAACGGQPGSSAGATVTVTAAAPTVTVTAPVETEDPATTDLAETAPVEAEDAESAAVAAEIVQVKAGFAQTGEAVGYGLVLQNRSGTDDALDVTVTANILSGDGTILSSDSQVITVIPAGMKAFLVGGETFLNGGDEAASVEAIIDVGRSETATYELPVVTKVRAEIDEYETLTVRGQVENPLDAPLSAFARINIVLFGDGGEVIGGGFTFLDAPLPPGRKAAFDSYMSAVPAQEIVRADATMVNEVEAE
jgi:hypothetical protein